MFDENLYNSFKDITLTGITHAWTDAGTDKKQNICFRTTQCGADA